MLNWPPISVACSNSVTVVTALAERRGAREAGGARADDRDALLRRRRPDHELGLVARARIDQAGRAPVLEHVIEARLVARDAGVDLVGAAVARLG